MKISRVVGEGGFYCHVAEAGQMQSPRKDRAD